jgi:hypothetical protein
MIYYHVHALYVRRCYCKIVIYTVGRILCTCTVNTCWTLFPMQLKLLSQYSYYISASNFISCTYRWIIMILSLLQKIIAHPLFCILLITVYLHTCLLLTCCIPVLIQVFVYYTNCMIMKQTQTLMNAHIIFLQVRTNSIAMKSWFWHALSFVIMNNHRLCCDWNWIVPCTFCESHEVCLVQVLIQRGTLQSNFVVQFNLIYRKSMTEKL